MEHVFFFNGNTKNISWIIQNDQLSEEEERIHTNIYLNKITAEQSKYVALHVGIFWSIGRYIIKNNDTINVMLDSKLMYEHLFENIETQDLFIQTKTMFLNQLIEQRNLKVNYQLIDPKENISTKLLKN